MKQISYWLLTVILLLIAFGCSKDAEMLGEVDPIEPPQEQTHRVPVEAALSELQAVLDGLDGGTRASGLARSVAWVSTVKAEDVIAETRTGDAADIEDLVYIANFENGEGYAILAADDRLESVIAITDQGSLTPEEFAAVANGEYDLEDGVELPVLPPVAAYARAGWNTNIGGGTIGGVGDGGTPNVGTTTTGHTPWKFNDKIGPFLPMKWGQGAPFNNKIPIKNGVHCKVGCVAVATAQVIVANMYRYYPNVFVTQRPGSVNWRVMYRAIDNFIARTDKTNGFFFNIKDTSPEVVEVANFLYRIAENVGMDYGANGSTTWTSNARDCLEDYGYRDAKLRFYEENLVYTMLVHRSLPTIVAGTASSNSGHMWVIDGLLQQTRYEQTVMNGTNQVVSSTQQYRTLFHCNFGWGGNHDGYYLPRAFFDTTRPADVTDPQNGDWDAFSPGSLYAHWQQIITYTGFSWSR